MSGGVGGVGNQSDPDPITDIQGLALLSAVTGLPVPAAPQEFIVYPFSQS